MPLLSSLRSIIIYLSPSYACATAQGYWSKAEKTHGDVTPSAFDFYYQNVAKIVKPSKSDRILDAGCGTGEITNAFHEDGYDIQGFDSSEKLISRAKARYSPSLFYVDDFIEMKNKRRSYSKIIVNNAFFYVHPMHYKKVLGNFHDILDEGGRLYLLDNPDYSKRRVLYDSWVKLCLTTYFPVYHINSAGFWVRDRDVQRCALEMGFLACEARDSWANSRTHFILTN